LSDENILNETIKINENILLNIFENYFLVDDQDFNHSFVPYDAIQKLSPNVNFVIRQNLLSHTQLLHDMKNRVSNDIISNNIKTLDELLEYAIFQAKYSQFSSIGHMCHMSYLDNDPYDVFNKDTETDQILRLYLY
jgi:hypothetical protein